MLSVFSLFLLLSSQSIASHGYVCPSLKEPTHGNPPVIVPFGNTVAAVYSCFSGYRLVGDEARLCVKQDYGDYYWTGSTPTCIIKDCSPTADPQNGWVSISEGKATYSCDLGYILVGSSVRVCKNGGWTGDAPKCSQDDSGCQTPSAPGNGHVSVVANRATYSCNYGYQLVGGYLRLCTYSNWNGTAPMCVKEQCPPLSSPANGQVQVTGSQKRARYTCASGYTLLGEAFRSCIYGIWLGSTPRCVKACPHLDSPANGFVHYLNRKNSKYTCRTGFSIQGAGKRTCLHGVWTGSQPSCVPTCRRLDSPSNGLVRVVGDTATYSCNAGYSLRGTNRRACSGGVWNGSKPSCVQVCPSLNSPLNGVVSVTATYTCDPGYRLLGNSRRTYSNGIWSGSEPSCDRIVCPSLRSPANGDVQISGNAATYSCNKRYELRGNGRRICSNGVWSGRQPSCVQMACVDGTEWRDGCHQLCTCVRGQPRCCRERKEVESMTVQELQLYVDTVIAASTNPLYRSRYEALLRIHRTEFHSGIHNIDQFLPWHRWFLLQYETLLRSINCTVTVPYWDWSLWAMTPFAATIWGSGSHQIGGNGSSNSHSCVQDGRFGSGTWSLPDGTCLSRQFKSGFFPGPVEVAEVLSYSPSQFRLFEIGLRVNLHNLVHCAIGGTMCSTDSVYAPEFFLHHGFIDKLWSDWQEKSLDHHNAHFSTKIDAMTSAGPTSPVDVIDNYNLPDGVSVCYATTDNPLEDVAIELRSLNPALLDKVPRPEFLSMTDDVFDVFRTSASDRRIASDIDRELRVGSLPLRIHDLSAVVSSAWNPQIKRLGFDMAIVTASAKWIPKEILWDPHVKTVSDPLRIPRQ